MNNEIVVTINEACHLLECTFRDGISEALFAQISELERIPGYFVDYGVNTHRGGLDKSIAQIKYNKAKGHYSAVKVIENALHALGFKSILWKRDINYGSRKSTVVKEVFDMPAIPKTQHQCESKTEKPIFEVCFTAEAVAQKVASYFTDTPVHRYRDENSTPYYVVKSRLLSEDVLLQILRDEHLKTDVYSYRGCNSASQSLKNAIDKLLVEMHTELSETENKPKTLFHAYFTDRTVAERVASFFTNTWIEKKGDKLYVITSPLISEETVRRILVFENLPQKGFSFVKTTTI